MKMNLPNKLTMLRVIMIPFFVFFLLTDCVKGSTWIALGLFCAASFTDFLDGQIARRCNLVTNFGKFMDPLADKLLVCSALICYVEMGLLPSWFVIVIIAREFIISGFRLIASDNGVVIAASWWGKFKTVFQMFMIIFIMVVTGIGKTIVWKNGLLYTLCGCEKCISNPYAIIANILCWAAFILTIVSLIDYLVKNKDVMKDSNN